MKPPENTSADVAPARADGQPKASERRAPGTNGEASGTSGGKAGTSGNQIEWAPFLAIAAVSVVITLVNATSGLMEAQSRGAVIDPRGPWVLEISSMLMVVVLAIPIGEAIRRLAPPARGMGAWLRFAGGHLVLASLFSLAHIAGMVGLRKLAYAAVGKTYVFVHGGDGGLGLPLLYEWRKDAITYVAVAATYWAFRRWFAGDAIAPAVPTIDARIEIRDGARVMLVEPVQIAWLEAAGNYVEFHVGAGTHLARGTLAAFEEKLKPRGFVRVHRSRLVNRARVKSFKPTPSGDLEITLDDGRVIAGSRRFRDALERAG